jgi:hypothetical protein
MTDIYAALIMAALVGALIAVSIIGGVLVMLVRRYRDGGR